MPRWLLGVLLSTTLFGQDFRATISGQVTDKTGAAIPHATVTAVRVDNDEATHAATNSDGYYTLSYLTPGSFVIEVAVPGFKTLTRKGIQLLVADKLDLPLTLEVGESRTSVTVTAEAELIHTGDASGGTSFDSLQVSEYALNGRQVYMLMGLATGVLFTQEDFGATGFSGTRGWDTNGSYTMNGGVQGTNQFLLNGAPISVNGSFQLAPNVDAIQEFKVMTNTYDAQFGRTGGGTVNTILKSGSNAWHGTAFDYARNSILDANVTQNKRNGFPRGKHITHQFGGTVGGTIRKDKDFVFLSFEGFREIVPFPVVTDSPPLILRDGQHFSTYNINIFDPLTNRTCVAGKDTPKGTSCYGTYIRSPFPGNVIPLSRISPVARKILELWPAPNLDGQTQNFLASNNTGRYRYDQPMGRWDHTFDQNNRIYGIVTFQHGHEYRNQNGFQPPAQTGNIVSERTDQNYIADWTRVISSRSILDVRLSFGRFTSYFPDGLNDFGFTADQLGMSLPHAPTVQRATAPHFNLDLYSGVIGNTYTWSTQNQWSLAPSLTQSRGKHTLRFGGELVYTGLGNGGPGRANGEFSFNRTWTQQYSDRGRDRYDGSGVADLLLGLPASGFIDWNDTYYRTYPYAAVYVQDDWKVRRNLTLNLGLRYDVQFPFVERWNRVS
ncbi:MAG: TonB-dependent receptor, partial [Acidobacteriota bacterium]|nr:TonB-dependent receptor [Acidobacteriota bacterium]